MAAAAGRGASRAVAAATSPAPVSRLDALYRQFLITRYFTRGWGSPHDLRRIITLRRQLSNRERALSFVEPARFPLTFTAEKVEKDHRLIDGHFTSPAVEYLEGVMPEEARQCHFQLVLPLEKDEERVKRPFCVQYAGTGDHFFWRRRGLMALPMLRERGIPSMIVENPYYGLRKPKEQLRSSLRNVSDLFVMGAALILESQVIYDWAEKQGYGPLISHGVSMGGHFATLAGSVWPKPLCIVPCMAVTSASLTFTQGVLSEAIPWKLLEQQYSETSAYRNEIRDLLACEERYEKLTSSAGQISHFNFDKPPSFFKRPAEVEAEFTPIESRPEKRKSSFVAEALNSIHVPIVSKVEKEIIRDPKVKAETTEFMADILDECTHIKNYPLPVDTDLVNVVVAEADAYQPVSGSYEIADLWKGAKMTFIPNKGHVSSYLFNQDVFRRAIYETVDRAEEKYGSNQTIM